MKFQSAIAAAGLVVGMASVFPAQAQQTFTVAGVKVSTAESGWTITEIVLPPLEIGGRGVDGSLPTESRLLVRKAADGRTLAALLVSANGMARRPVAFQGSPQCVDLPPRGFYAVTLREPVPGVGPACLVLGFAYQGVAVTQSLSEVFGAAITARGTVFPPATVLVVSFAADSSAARFDVEGFLDAEAFTGLVDVKAKQEPPESFPPQVAAWGDALGRTTLQALNGIFSREARLPPINFSTPDAPQ